MNAHVALNDLFGGDDHWLKVWWDQCLRQLEGFTFALEPDEWSLRSGKAACASADSLVLRWTEWQGATVLVPQQPDASAVPPDWARSDWRTVVGLQIYAPLVQWLVRVHGHHLGDATLEPAPVASGTPGPLSWSVICTGPKGRLVAQIQFSDGAAAQTFVDMCVSHARTPRALVPDAVNVPAPRSGRRPHDETMDGSDTDASNVDELDEFGDEEPESEFVGDESDGPGSVDDTGPDEQFTESSDLPINGDDWPADEFFDARGRNARSAAPDRTEARTWDSDRRASVVGDAEPEEHRCSVPDGAALSTWICLESLSLAPADLDALEVGAGIVLDTLDEGAIDCRWCVGKDRGWAELGSLRLVERAGAVRPAAKWCVSGLQFTPNRAQATLPLAELPSDGSLAVMLRGPDQLARSILALQHGCVIESSGHELLFLLNGTRAGRGRLIVNGSTRVAVVTEWTP